ncbi:hypothetical protein AB1Y20_018408 [Prymnesium parvum]|uniref:Protein kinase domain-containing protein n=1 Tax=Prymnesium parvum TaxID=97485 RepID=A0AB34JNB5_PRYPA
MTENRTTHTPDGQYAFDLSATGMLGNGAHGIVRVARHVDTGECVAIKIMSAATLGSLAKELTAQGKLDHPHIIKLLGTQVDLDKRRVYMVMELCTGGELFDRIAECGKLEEAAARRYLAQMASALGHCHGLNVYHRDLKPENILLDEHDNVKIADFGLASIVKAEGGHVDEDASYLQHTKCGSIMYAAPEVLISNQVNGYSAAKADIWSLGIVLYSMLSGALPFQVALASKCPRYKRVLQHGMHALCNANGFSAGATELLCRMVAPLPEKRCTIQDVLASPWLVSMLDPKLLPAHYKWCHLLEVDRNTDKQQNDEEAAGAPAKRLRRTTNSSSERSSNGASSQTEISQHKGKTQSGGSSASSKQSNSAKLDEEGVNGLLVRSLGWVRLPSDKERMVGEVARALENLGVPYSVVRGELSDVVWVGEKETPANLGPDDVLDESFAPTGKLTVRIQIHPNMVAGEEKSDIHIERHAGDVLEFHSFYRDVRHELAGANGWRSEMGHYSIDVDDSA